MSISDSYGLGSADNLAPDDHVLGQSLHSTVQTTKRPRSRATSHDSCETSEAGNPGPRKRTHTDDKSFTPKPQHGLGYLIIHEVSCVEDTAGHDSHEEGALFLDTPHLFANDSKASALRGSQEINNLEIYLESNPGISFVVTRYYGCGRYHDDNEKLFERIGDARLLSEVSYESKPYLYRLVKDGPQTVPDHEAMWRLSSGLVQAMSAADLINPGIFNEPEVIREPYINIYHSRGCFEVTKMGLIPSHILELENPLAYVYLARGDDFAEADDLFRQGKVSKSHLSKLFRPNDLLVQVVDGEERVVKIESYMAAETSSRISLSCWSWQFDGLFRKAQTGVHIAWPDSEMDVVTMTTLSAYPLRFGDPKLRDRLETRGRSLWNCREKKFVGYMGATSRFEEQTATPRYMVDMKTYNKLHPKETKTQAGRDDLGDAAFKEETPPSSEFLLLLPGKAPGYGFHDKSWVDISLKHIVDVCWDKTAFERLVLETSKKALIKALITVQADTKQSPDIIEGLILLLHGAPGTGKTLTAESVAELAQKPLYRVTCGDVGTEPEAVERYLESVLHIGTIWDCVVLLDEADVFFEERSRMDLQRNALVSVFLRVLEYYQGILILTTNRVGAFDEAFKSRIQLAMHYPVLGFDQRLEIWDNLIFSLGGNDEINVGELKSKSSTLARHELNGRQIRNTMKTAKQLAFYRKERLGYSHVDSAIKVADEFERYIKETHGQTDEERAVDAYIRSRPV